MEKIQKQIDDCVSDKDEKIKLLNFVNNCYNNNKCKKIMVLYGEGCGKSTFIKILEKYFKKNVYYMESYFYTDNIPITEANFKKYEQQVKGLENQQLVVGEVNNKSLRKDVIKQLISSTLYTPFGKLNNTANYLIHTSNKSTLEYLSDEYYEIIHFDKIKPKYLISKNCSLK